MAWNGNSLEFWYYRILVLMTGNLKDATIAVDALSVWYVKILFCRASMQKKIVKKIRAFILISLCFFNGIGFILMQHEHQWVGNDDSFRLLSCNRVHTCFVPSLCSVSIMINSGYIRFCIYYLEFNYRVRVSNELGAGNGKAAKFAMKVSVVESTIIGLLFCSIIMIFRGQIALIFSSSTDVLKAVENLSYLLAFTIFLNSVQPVLSGMMSYFSF